MTIRSIIKLLLTIGLIFLNFCVLAEDDPNRDDSKTYHIAWNINGKWEIFKPTEIDHIGYEVDMRNIHATFYIGVPKNTSDEYQYLYVHTRRMEDQPLSLQRNKSKFFYYYVYNDKEEWIPSSGITQIDFMNYHNNSDNISAAKYAHILNWHAPYSKVLKTPKTYELVQHIIPKLSDDIEKQFAAERLLRLIKNRPKMSWVKVRTKVPPKEGDALHVAFAYSHDIEPSHYYIKFIKR